MGFVFECNRDKNHETECERMKAAKVNIVQFALYNGRE
jgi:hypothetical protein